MISDDEYLERIVAGIQAVTTTDADVCWNEKINGRQFDVVVRFTLGTLRYLVVIEVKNRKRKAEAEDLDAFVNKARDQNANKMVFVNVAGFQEGAITIAKRHGVDLFTVTFDEKEVQLPSRLSYMILSEEGAPKDIPPRIEVGEPMLVANLQKVTLVYSDGKRFDMPNEPSQMNYYAIKTTLQDGRSLDDVLQTGPFGEVELEKSRLEKITLDTPQQIEPPDDYCFPSGILASMECVVAGVLSRPVKGNTLIDPTTFVSPIVYTNVLTGDSLSFAIDQLPLGPKRVSVGSFYFIPHPLIYYYCSAIKNKTVRWHVIESFQNGALLTGSIEQDIKYSWQYIPVSDKETLRRLKRRLADFRKRSRNKQR
ncbi:MAG: hypothetical protein Kow00114_06860 [Kiloniellaceae bacterium]